MICDVAKYQGKIDWAKLAPALDFVIIKASGKEPDPRYPDNVAGAVRYKVPFHVYHFLYCTTEAAAKKEAARFFNTVNGQGHMPLFWVLDCEKKWGVKDANAPRIVDTFVTELRRLAGDIRVAIYVAQQKYYDWKIDYSSFAYVWIPGYGEKWKPEMPCDMWQYTDKGTAPGISGNVDLDMLMGDKPMSFFTTPPGPSGHPPLSGEAIPPGPDEPKDENDNKSGGEKDMAVKIGSARIDENGNAKGGKAGDQTGKEVSTQSWYKHKKGWRVFRAKDPAVAEKIAEDMQWACDNRHIGYDQGQRLTLYDVAKPLGFNCKLVKTNCETDCSALVRVCCAYAGVMLPNFRTNTEPAALMDSGAFVEMKGSKYTDSSDYLKRGDILCTKTQGHTVVVLTNGPKEDKEPEPDPKLGDRTLRKGDTGSDVTELQNDLMQLGYSMPKYGADGDFGSETEKAVKAFQLAYGLTDDGVMNKGKDFDTLFAALDGAKPTGQRVEITGHVNIRTAPGYDSKIIGTAHAGETYPWQGVTKEAEGKPWYLIEYKGKNGWVSGKYSKLVN